MIDLAVILGAVSLAAVGGEAFLKSIQVHSRRGHTTPRAESCRCHDAGGLRHF